MLPSRIEKLFDQPPEHYEEEHFQLFSGFKAALNRGEIRAAEPDPASPTGWRTNAWVKKGILIGFRMGVVVNMAGATPLDSDSHSAPCDEARQPFFDKSTFPVRALALGDGVRVVPGGSSIRDGCYVAHGVICMPPMFINVGAYVGEGTMIDSHALVGSCAQIGRRCHISAAAQIGGVLEPVGASPVIIEDDVLIGGNCGVYEGTVVKKRAVLGSGAILNRSTPVYDLVRADSRGDGVAAADYSGSGNRRPGISLRHARSREEMGTLAAVRSHRQISRRQDGRPRLARRPFTIASLP